MPVMSRLGNGSTRSFGQRGAVDPIDPYFKSVVLLLSTTSLTNADNSRFLDSSSSYTPLSRNGNVSQGSFSPYDPNWSNYFDGTGDYLDIAANAAFNLSGDFTIEFWINTTQTTNSWITGFYNSNPDFTSQVGYLVAISSGNYLLSLNSGSTETTFTIGAASSISNGAWHHIACTRSGNTVRTFLDGVLATTTTYSSTLNNPAGSIYRVGGLSGKFEAPFAGYISNLRIVKGTALYTGNFGPPISPLTAISGTSLLMCQSNRIRDASTNNFSITKNGDTTVSPFSPFTFSKPGAVYNQSDISYWSGYFDGSGDYLSAPTNTAYDISGGDYTVEAWINLSALPATNNSGNRVGGLAIYSSGFGGGWEIGVDLTQNLVSISQPGSSSLTSASYTFAIGQWYHVAVCRASGTNRIFVNGTSLTLATNTFPNNSTGSAQLRIAAGLFSGGYDHYFPGYISDFRIVKGTGLYSSNFTPPSTPLTAVSGTSLLTCQNAAFADNSANKAVITQYGNATVIGNNPYQSGYYSNYFDGSGDYLSIADNAALQMGSGDFTVEFWWNPSSISSYQTPFDKGYTGSGALLFQTGNGDGKIIVYASGSAVITASTAVTVGAWNHMALVRNGTSLVLYLNGVSVGSATNSTNFNSTSSVGIGANVSGGGGAGAYPINGYLSNLRVVKGTAVYTATFTPPTAPLTAISGTGLLTCQANRLIDSSANAFALTKVGDTSVVPFDPFYTATVASSGGSIYLEGIGSTTSMPFVYGSTSINYDLQSGGTIECWIYPTARSPSADPPYFGTNAIWALYGTSLGGLTKYFSMSISSNGNLFISSDLSAYNENVSSTVIPLNTWTHIAWVRSGGTNKFYVNGVDVTATFSNPNPSWWPSTATSNQPYVGVIPYLYGSYSYLAPFRGYISNFRITKGTAVYTSAFTPPTSPLNPAPSTTLLINGMNAGIYDAAMQNNLETVGNAQVSSVKAKYGTTSVYFDGSGDGLWCNTPSPALVNADFTWECWVNFNSLTGNPCLINVGTAASDRTLLYFDATNGIRYAVARGNVDQISIQQGSTTGWSTGVWYHVALVRSGNTYTIYRNGTSVATGTSTYAQSIITGFTIGFSASGLYLNGYLDDVRITNGYARYTANFGPPARALPIR